MTGAELARPFDQEAPRRGQPPGRLSRGDARGRGGGRSRRRGPRTATWSVRCRGRPSSKPNCPVRRPAVGRTAARAYHLRPMTIPPRQACSRRAHAPPATDAALTRPPSTFPHPDRAGTHPTDRLRRVRRRAVRAVARRGPGTKRLEHARARAATRRHRRPTAAAPVATPRSPSARSVSTRADRSAAAAVPVRGSASRPAVARSNRAERASWVAARPEGSTPIGKQCSRHRSARMQATRWPEAIRHRPTDREEGNRQSQRPSY